jgi:hypothetical protein
MGKSMARDFPEVLALSYRVTDQKSMAVRAKPVYFLECVIIYAYFDHFVVEFAVRTSYLSSQRT